MDYVVVYVQRMKPGDAVELIEDAVRGRAGVWADIGAGSGTFTRALVELLGAGSRIYAVDRDRAALSKLSKLERWSAAEPSAADVIAVEADFTRPFTIDPEVQLDGLLLANALHFVRDAEDVLARLASMVRPRGRVVIVEYDRRDASRWVPYPIPMSRLPALAAAARLTAPTVTATVPSQYQGILYAAACDRLVV